MSINDSQEWTEKYASSARMPNLERPDRIHRLTEIVKQLRRFVKVNRIHVVETSHLPLSFEVATTAVTGHR